MGDTMPELQLQISEAERAELDERASASGLTLRDFIRTVLRLPDHESSVEQQDKERAEYAELRWAAMRESHSWITGDTAAPKADEAP